jgi:membrane-associated protease RseP (regulator of RpoE activity)
METAMMRMGMAFVLVGLAAPAAAQEAVYVRRAAPAWLGISYEVRWLERGGQCEPQVVVESVVQGSPAERAGLRSGDAILALDGHADPAGRLPYLAGRLVPGDSVRLRVFRSGSIREIAAVADLRPDRPPSVMVSPQKGTFRVTGAPVVRMSGDTLIATNLDEAPRWSGRSGTGYWIAYDDGRAEYRRLTTRSRDALDRRVSNLLVCADTAHWQVEPRAVVSGELHRIQARADSLRVVITERALTRETEEQRKAVLLELLERAREREPVLPAAPAHAYTYSYTLEYPGVGDRGVAGAEVTSLEPELAEYFRGVSDGLLVLRVSTGTPADRAGLRPGDVITAGDGRPVASVDDLRRALSRPDDSPVELRVVRQGRSRTVTLRR